MPGFIPVLLGAALIGGAIVLSKKSAAAPSGSLEIYVEPAGSLRPGDSWEISQRDISPPVWIGVHRGPDKDGWAVAPAFGATRQEVIDKINGKTAQATVGHPPLWRPPYFYGSRR